MTARSKKRKARGGKKDESDTSPAAAAAEEFGRKGGMKGAGEGAVSVEVAAPAAAPVVVPEPSSPVVDVAAISDSQRVDVVKVRPASVWLHARGELALKDVWYG